MAKDVASEALHIKNPRRAQIQANPDVAGYKERPAITLVFYGAPSGTRTHTESILSRLPLPIGLWGQSEILV